MTTSATMSQCYREARKHWGERGAAIVALAAKHYDRSADEILEVILETGPCGGDASEFAQGVWRPSW